MVHLQGIPRRAAAASPRLVSTEYSRRSVAATRLRKFRTAKVRLALPGHDAEQLVLGLRSRAADTALRQPRRNRARIVDAELVLQRRQAALVCGRWREGARLRRGVATTRRDRASTRRRLKFVVVSSLMYERRGQLTRRRRGYIRTRRERAAASPRREIMLARPHRSSTSARARVEATRTPRTPNEMRYALRCA